MNNYYSEVNTLVSMIHKLSKQLQQAEERAEEAKTVIGNLEEENRKLNIELLHVSESNVAAGRVESLQDYNTALKNEVDQLKRRNEDLEDGNKLWKSIHNGIISILKDTHGFTCAEGNTWTSIVQDLSDGYVKMFKELAQVEEVLHGDKGRWFLSETDPDWKSLSTHSKVNDIINAAWIIKGSVDKVHNVNYVLHQESLINSEESRGEIDNLLKRVQGLEDEINTRDNWSASLEHTIKLLTKQIDVYEERIKGNEERIVEYIKDRDKVLTMLGKYRPIHRGGKMPDQLAKLIAHFEQKGSYGHIPIFTASVTTAEDLKERLFELEVENAETRKLRKYLVENGCIDPEGFSLYNFVTELIEECYED